ITAVTETHIHADFASGSRELAARTGAKLYLSDEGDASWKYAFAAEAGAVLVRDGDSFWVGNAKIEVLHTPGHTPEHLCFMLTDTRASHRPMGIFTGDFVFVGDVGRPDLLEKAAKVVGSAASGARTLFRSLQRFKALPDYLQIWPGHGAGSACGKGIGAVPQTSLGYERLANWAFAYDDEDAFVSAVLAGQPEPPKYFAQMKRINKEGPPIMGGFRRPPRRPGGQLLVRLAQGATVIDTRPFAAFAAGHVPGTLSIPLDYSFATWAGWLISYDAPFFLLAADDAPRVVDQAVRELAKIGLDQVAGYAGGDALAAWTVAGRELEIIPQITPEDLAALARTERVALIDVRGESEWLEAHMPAARHIALGYLVDRLDEIPRDRPVVVYCRSGARSSIAAGLLQAKGFKDVRNLVGGIARWQAAGHAVERAA
ncbi:MAG: MBL fold metallo-hydrolase, partial [Chloroflexi bacterium]|nr:MBL fold metallo-hydrolase [Chloroflexota bacterium]